MQKCTNGAIWSKTSSAISRLSDASQLATKRPIPALLDSLVWSRFSLPAGDCKRTLERFPLNLNREDYRGSLGRANQIRLLRRQRRGCAMAKGYSKDLRERVVSIVEEGDSAGEAARLLNVGASTAIRWIERWTTTGSVEAKPGTGHSRSPLNKHEQWLLDLIASETDLTLDDTGLGLSGAKKLKVGTSSIWRFYDRQEITFKKNSARHRAGSS